MGWNYSRIINFTSIQITANITQFNRDEGDKRDNGKKQGFKLLGLNKKNFKSLRFYPLNPFYPCKNAFEF
jgi:hypothetical protein